jgi:hypothetical protein
MYTTGSTSRTTSVQLSRHVIQHTPNFTALDLYERQTVDKEFINSLKILNQR